jgi:hypothetical protein
VRLRRFPSLNAGLQEQIMCIPKPLIFSGLALLSAGATLTLAAEPTSGSGETNAATDKVKAAVTPGEFVLSGSDVKTINDSGKLRRYRVCLKKEQSGDTDLKINYDDRQTVVKLGDCKTVEGKKIEATPASSLSGDNHIVGTYHRERHRGGSSDTQ